MYRIINFLFLIFFLQISSASFVNDYKIWSSVKRQVIELKKNNKFIQALRALNSFETSFSKSQLIPLVYYEKALIYLKNEKSIEKGFVYLEKAQITRDKNLSQKIIKEKNVFSKQITRVRLKRIKYYLDKYFMSKVFFPESLNVLKQHYKGLRQRDLKDGYGDFFIYQVETNLAVKEPNLFNFQLYSKGLDKKKQTEDDIVFINKILDKTSSIQVLNVFIDGDQSKGEVLVFDSKNQSDKKFVIKEGDSFFGYFVFSIKEEGVIFLKDEVPIVVNIE